MAISHYSIMILESAPEDRLLYCRYLSQDRTATYDVLEAESGLKALTQLTDFQPDLILLNYQLPDVDGLEFLSKLRSQFGSLQIPVIMLANQGDEAIAVAAMKNGALDYMVKSKLTPNGLHRGVHTALEKTRLIKQIQMQEQQKQLFAGISFRIRQFLHLEEILKTAVEEVRELLKADRTIVYQFDQQMNGKIVAESVLPSWKAVLNLQIQESLLENNGTSYRDYKIRAISDIYDAGLTTAYINLLEQFQVKANLVVPIFLNTEARGQVAEDKKQTGNLTLLPVSQSSSHVLWGLLIAHQCSETREWQTNELDILQQLSVQLSVAIQQAQLYENLQNLNTSLEQKVEERTQELQASERRFRAIFNNTFQFTGLLTTEGILLEANQTVLNFGGIKIEDVVNRPFWEAYWWQISQVTQDNLKKNIARAAQGEFIRYEVNVLGAAGVATIDFSLRPLKNELDKVVMLIAEGRDITEKKRVESERLDALQALKTSEIELRGLFNAMVDVIVVLDKQGRYLKIAPTNTDKLYRPAQEVLGKTVHEVLPGHIADLCMSMIEQTLARQESLECAYSLQIGNQHVWFDAKVSPISPEAVIWVARDISTAKRSEIIRQQAEQAFQESQTLLQLVMDSLPMAIFWKDKNCRYLGCNRQLVLDAGVSSLADIIGKTDFDMPWKDQAPLYQAGDRLVMESGLPQFNLEEPCTNGENLSRWLRTNKIPLLTPAGEIIGVLVSYEDITERKEMERALEKSERRYATLAASAPVGIYRTDIAGNCLYVNDRWCQIAGLTPEEATGFGWTRGLHPEDREMIAAEWNQYVQTGKTFNLEYRFQQPDGAEIWVFGQAVPELDQEGTVIGYVGTVTDINRRKQAEKALRQSEQLYRSLVDNFPNGVVVLFDHNLRYLLVGGLGLASAGLSKAEMEGKTIWEIFTPEVTEMIAPLLRQALAGESVIAEVPYRDRFYITHNIPVRDDQGNVIAGILMSQDITQRKQSEDALKTSEEKFRQFAENSREVILLRQIDSGKLLYVNPAYEKIWQQTSESLYENPDSWMNFLHPSDRQRIHSAYQNAGGQIFLNEEYRIIRPDGSMRWIRGRCFPIRNAAGEIYRIGAMAEDITDRKYTEEERDHLLQILEEQNQTLETQVTERTAELQQSEKRFRNLVETSSDWVWEINECGIYTYASPQIFDVLGYSPEEVLGKTPFHLMPPEESLRVLTQFMKFILIQAPFQCLENIHLHKDGRLITLETSAVPIFDEDGEFRGYRGMDRDITIRKLSEATLRQNEVRFQRIAANVPGVMYQYLLHPDGSHKFVYVSDRCKELYELPSATMLENGNVLFNMTHPDDLPTLQESMIRSASTLQQWSWEGRIITPSGHIKWIQGVAQPQKQANGDILWDGLILDISERARMEAERKKIEIALRNLSDRLDLAIKSAQIGIWDWDIVNDCLLWDDQMYELYGVQASNFTGAYQAWEAGLHPDDLLFCRDAIQQAIAGKSDFEPEFRVIWPDGTIKFIKAYALIQSDSQGKAQRMIGINFDISERKQSEAQLQAAEVQLRSLSDRLSLAVKSAKIGIWDLDLINDSLVWDEQMYEIFGVTPLNFDPSQGAWAKFEEFVHPDDKITIRNTVQQVIAEDRELDIEFRIILSNGTIRILKGYAIVQHNSQGQAQRMIGVNYDITSRKLAEAEIIRSRDLREAIFNESADALFLVDAETVKTIDCNQRAVEMFAAANKIDLINIDGHELQKLQFTSEEMQAIVDDMNKQGFWSQEIEYKTFKGDLFWGSLAAKQITVASQKMNLVRVTDISQRKLAEEQLHQTNKQLAAFNHELARATRLKDEFLANMSHELRTPLNAILGISEALQDEVLGVITEKQRRGLQTIERSGNHLLELINDILDLSKIEAGQLELHYTQIAISPLCQSSLSFIKQQAFQKHIHLEVKIQPNLPDLLLDERRIRQVLINLLNNAVKFTPEGGQITLEVTHQQLDPEADMTSLRNWIQIAVIDTGIGIAPENINKLFQPFIQIDSSLNRQYAGTGLGLALVKRIVEIHGGRVGVSSEIGVGSRFTFDLPCGHVSEPAQESVQQISSNVDSTAHNTPQESPLILLAEDNEANIFTISNYLEAKGYRIILAKNGQQAIALTKEQTPDLILMDIQMPGIDGMEAIKLIRVEPKLANIPIIALTALAMPGDQEKCLAAGADYYLTKPVILKQLVTTMQQLLSAKKQ
ncbi:PAS domain S-box protein [Anabaena cylindrica FACHB-243]|nr:MULTISPECIES: PAS domain S-box protein [Anabaena]MBD2421260.1 PAS domain S-box protein [Anabaena cylindrica FACHB-243]MBY5284125.1 PAS domain S-box protein [Anabaena sp. CCAP 1446/1C]MBY5308091.1 PAS domain S-box protein [Anabaena sp. CCAP 1446/1C]MCM2406591.1 PAS domain S-box protein [Anabaena sp. CCAP 1446/1C]